MWVGGEWKVVDGRMVSSHLYLRAMTQVWVSSFCTCRCWLFTYGQSVLSSITFMYAKVLLVQELCFYPLYVLRSEGLR